MNRSYREPCTTRVELKKKKEKCNQKRCPLVGKELLWYEVATKTPHKNGQNGIPCWRERLSQWAIWMSSVGKKILPSEQGQLKEFGQRITKQSWVNNSTWNLFLVCWRFPGLD